MKNRTEAKKKLLKLRKELEQVEKYLNQTCKHRNVTNECVSPDWDHFKYYRDRCEDCGKIWTIRGHSARTWS